jgi:hypothetical protein
MHSARFFAPEAKPAGYGSFDADSSAKKQGYLAFVDELISKITAMILALESVRSDLRDMSWAFLDKETFLNVVKAQENYISPNNNWPFGLDEIELKDFLTSIHLDISCYLPRNKRLSLYNDLRWLTHRLSKTYMFTLEQCELINNYHSVKWFRDLESEMMNQVAILDRGVVDDPSLNVFAKKINKLADFLTLHFIQFDVINFDYKAPVHGKILARRLVVLGIQLQPFFNIGTQDKNYHDECSSDISTETPMDDEDKVEEVDGSYFSRCPIM